MPGHRVIGRLDEFVRKTAVGDPRQGCQNRKRSPARVGVVGDEGPSLLERGRPLATWSRETVMLDCTPASSAPLFEKETSASPWYESSVSENDASQM